MPVMMNEPPLFDMPAFQAALPAVRALISPTLQYAWPLLKLRTGLEIMVKHEAWTPIGSFKLRGGLVFMDRLRQRKPDLRAVVTATRGNHGQSIALAGRRAGFEVTIVVPLGNAEGKNAAMRALGANLIEHGADFDEACAHARAFARDHEGEFVPAFHPDLVLGVASAAYELLTAAPDLDRVYAPIGLGSVICGLITMRDLLDHKAKIVGVVAQGANAHRLSFEAGRIVQTAHARTFADGLATHIPDETAFSVIRRGADHIVEVSDAQIAEALRIYLSDVHMLTEGAGAAALAGLLKEADTLRGQRLGVIATGQNIDPDWLRIVLDGGVPAVAP